MEDTSVTKNIFWFCPSNSISSSIHFWTTVLFSPHSRSFPIPPKDLPRHAVSGQISSLSLGLSSNSMSKYASRNFLMVQDNAQLFSSTTNHLYDLRQFTSLFQTLHCEPAHDFALSWKETLGMTTRQIRTLITWLWLQLWMLTTILIQEMCGSNLLQGFILSCVGLSDQTHMLCGSMFFFIRWCWSVSAWLQPACLCLSPLLLWSACLKLCKRLSSPDSSLSLRHKLLAIKSHSRNFVLFSSLESPEKPCTGWPPSFYLFRRNRSRAALLDTSPSLTLPLCCTYVVWQPP